MEVKGRHHVRDCLTVLRETLQIAAIGPVLDVAWAVLQYIILCADVLG